MMLIDNTISVGLGELQISNNPNHILACYGLGSCIGLAAYDPHLKIGGMLHIVLPSGKGFINNKSIFKFADTGIPAMIEEMSKIGASTNNLIIKIAGGARMVNGVNNGFMDIGEKNIESVYFTIHKLGMKIHAEDIRGNWGRSMWLHIGSGQILVKTLSQKIIEL